MKDEAKYKKVDELTLEVVDETGTKVWTIDTLTHAVKQAKDDVEKAQGYQDYYQNILDKAIKLGVKTASQIEEEKKSESEGEDKGTDE